MRGLHFGLLAIIVDFQEVHAKQAIDRENPYIAILLLLSLLFQ